MTPFDYAHPETEAEAVEFLSEFPAETALLAGGTDLVSLLKQEVLQPRRVVDIKNVASLHGIREADGGLLVGTLTTLEEMNDSPLLREHRSLRHVIDGIRAIQVQANGTLGGDLCLLPNCWYFRSGYGLLARSQAHSRSQAGAWERGKSLPEIGDNRYHAVFGNSGPAKFVSASRFAPPAIAWNAKVRLAGPKPGRDEWLPLDGFFRTPKTAKQGVTVLKPGQFVTHVWLPKANGRVSASYEVLQSEGLDWPLAAAAATLRLELGVVAEARIVLGHVAPTPRVTDEAAEFLIGKSLNEATAAEAADIATADATPLSMNEYKVQLARTAVKRALLRAVES
jgi:xanthine dehydrogenase YagS FAD-binding subunit